MIFFEFINKIWCEVLSNQLVIDKTTYFTILIGQITVYGIMLTFYQFVVSLQNEENFITSYLGENIAEYLNRKELKIYKRIISKKLFNVLFMLEILCLFGTVGIYILYAKVISPFLARHMDINIALEECMQIVVMYEEYIGIETNIEHICPQFDAWIIDVRTLEYILADTVGKGRFDYFVDYVKKRKNGYGLVEVQSGEEILVYNLYKQFPVLFEKNYGDIGISVHI